MTTRFKKARFHISTGPKSLFNRINFKIRGKSVLKVHSHHLNKRISQRGIPIEEIVEFNQDKWELMTAEVRVNKGKFVNCAWRKSFNDTFLWIVVGYKETVETVILKDGIGFNEQIVISGELYNFVDKVNKNLMADAR